MNISSLNAELRLHCRNNHDEEEEGEKDALTQTLLWCSQNIGKDAAEAQVGSLTFHSWTPPMLRTQAGP